MKKGSKGLKQYQQMIALMSKGMSMSQALKRTKMTGSNFYTYKKKDEAGSLNGSTEDGPAIVVHNVDKAPIKRSPYGSKKKVHSTGGRIAVVIGTPDQLQEILDQL